MARDFYEILCLDEHDRKLRLAHVPKVGETVMIFPICFDSPKSELYLETGTPTLFRRNTSCGTVKAKEFHKKYRFIGKLPFMAVSI